MSLNDHKQSGEWTVEDGDRIHANKREDRG